MKKVAIYRSKGPITKNIIQKFAQKYNIVFPTSYIELLSENNWLRLISNAFSFTNTWNKKDERDINFYGYDIESYAGSRTIMDAQDFDIFGTHQVIAIGFSANGDYICFDYRKDPTSSEPEVVLMHHDQYIKDEQGNPKMAISKIANNFEDFIDMLHE